MSEARVRGQPEGATARERIRIWLDREPGVGEHMTWVGKDYSLAQLKADVREALTVHSACTSPRVIPPGKKIDADNVTDEDCADLAALIEREHVKATIAGVYKTIEESGFSEPFRSGLVVGVEELEFRLLESWGEDANKAGPLAAAENRAWPSCPKCGARVESIGNPCPAKCRDEPLREGSGECAVTHSGGKPHAVGDRGQRYEISFFNPATNERQVLGWTDDIEAARRMADGVDLHPVWEFPWVTDRQAGMTDTNPKPSLPEHDAGCATNRGGYRCDCRLSVPPHPKLHGNER